jgi:hypothetical protein
VGFSGPGAASGQQPVAGFSEHADKAAKPDSRPAVRH